MKAEAGVEFEEMAYVVLADRVGFFGLPVQERRALEMELSDAVEEVVSRLPFGEPKRIVSEEDGVFAIVFFGDGEAAAETAADLQQAIRSVSDAPLRIGCHFGKVVRQRNAAGKWAVWGRGLAEGRRIMACSDGTSVVASRSFSESVGQIEGWTSRFVGDTEREVIHGETLQICTMITDGLRRQERAFGLPTSSEFTRGALPLASPIYVERQTDQEFRRAVAAGESIVLVKGGRQIGKTSLLARALGEAREAGATVLLTDFQAYGTAELDDPDRLYRVLANEMTSQLRRGETPPLTWDPLLGPNINFERFIVESVLDRIPGRVVWAMDEVDRLFTAPYAGDFFGLIRSWHNRRALDSTGPWSRLTIAIAHATEAHLFVADLNQSPFNVGLRLDLADFTVTEVALLNRRFGSPLNAEQVSRFHSLVGGQPYLSRYGLEVLVRKEMTLAEFESVASNEDGPFGDHLRRILIGVRSDFELAEELRQLLSHGKRISRDGFYRLRSAGILRGDSVEQARPRCRIYEDFLTQRLEG